MSAQLVMNQSDIPGNIIAITGTSIVTPPPSRQALIALQQAIVSLVVLSGNLRLACRSYFCELTSSGSLQPKPRARANLNFGRFAATIPGQPIVAGGGILDQARPLRYGIGSLYRFEANRISQRVKIATSRWYLLRDSSWKLD
jgi:hypothetical protein